MDPRLDVDVRFLLANERTLLAWVRTALTLLAAGAAVTQLVDGLHGGTVVAVVLLALGIASAVVGALRHAAADRAIRSGVLPAAGRGHYVVAGVVALVGVALVVAVLLA